ncbi:hypothetical protein ABPG75_012715 [Micractinium tetrahymenae]
MRRAAAVLVLLLAAAAAAAALRATPSREGACPLRSGGSAADRRERHAKECPALVHKYMEAHTADLEAEQDVSKFIFFLHVPRTAGKTYANCFLRSALPPSTRCAKSYDVVRLNVSAPDCQALISHDDFSISQWFPPGASTITQLRRPVDRLLSAYEFAVDVAAKGVMNLETPRKNPKRKTDFVGTLEVWPWSVLIPWFKQDMRQRLDKLRTSALSDPTAWRDYLSPDNKTYYWNEAKNESVWVLPDAEPVLDPYNNSLVMPLHEWVEHPVAEELLHNGAALQVLGLTNYSYWPEAGELRRCVRSSWVAREMLLALATKRLRRMAHVGLTERLDESVVSMAADLGLNFSGPAYKYTSASAFSYDGGAVDQDELITYNATTQGGINVTLARSQATQRLQEILAEENVLREEIDLMVPRLKKLVDKEAAWLAEQEELKQAAEAEEAEKAGQQHEDEAPEQHGAGSAEAPAPGESEQADEAAANAAVDAAGAQDATIPAAEAEAAQDEGGATDAADGVTEADVAEGDGSEQQQEGQAGTDGEHSPPPYDDGSQAHYAEAVAEEPPAEEEEDTEPIVSPWSKEIEELDGVVAAKQEHIRQLEGEMASLQHSNLIVSVDSATGRARQILPDDLFMVSGDTLGQAYRRCADAGRGRSEKRRPYKHLRTPWGETFRFSPEARARIPPAVLARIHQLNALDEELWKAGNEVLERKLAEQREKGVLQVVPPTRHPPPASSGHTSKRRLHSTKEFVTNRHDWQASSFGKPTDGGDILYSHPPPPPTEAAAATQPASEVAASDGAPAVEDGGSTFELAAAAQAVGEQAAEQAAIEHVAQQAAEQQAAAEQAAAEHAERQAVEQQAAAAEDAAPLEGNWQGELQAAAEEQVQLGSAPSREEL